MNRRLFLAGTAGLAAGGLLAGAPHRSLGLGVAEAATLGPWPDQAVLFDGSTGPNNTYYDALSQIGILADLLGFTDSCPVSGHQLSGGVITLAAGPAVYQSLLNNVGPYIIPEAPPQSILPPPLLVAKNDCDLLSAISAVEQYVQSVTSQTQTLLSQVKACRDHVRELWCEVVTAAEQAATLPPLPPPVTGSLPLPGPDAHFEIPNPDDDDIFKSPVCQGILALIDLPAFLDDLAFRRLDCAKTEAILTATQASLTATVSQFGGLTPDEKQGFTAVADANLSRAEEHVASSEATAATINSLTTHLSAESLAASCALCTGQVVLPPRPSGAVTIDGQRQLVDRLVKSLRSAAALVVNRDYGARLRDFAQRLARVPDNRVYNVIFPSVSSVGQQFLALRAESQADDRSLPRVVLLTAMPRDARLPPMNVADLRLLFQAFRVFDQMLRIGGAI